jgi:BirA family biotin operon repressor/biotin-[acetyl-CoA-carboxylase] ligase
MKHTLRALALLLGYPDEKLRGLLPDLAAAIDAARDRLGPFARLRYKAAVESTNNVAMALAAAGEPEGTTVLTDEQHRGRGRLGRDWFSPAGSGIYLSAVVRPRGPVRVVPLVTLAAGVAAARAIHGAAGLPVELKWPNDLVIGRPWRKAGGVLCETAGTAIEAVVVGIGINLRATAYPASIAHRATSIETELGRVLERANLVAALLGELRRVVEDMHAGSHAAVLDAWRAFAAAGLGGRVIRWSDPLGEHRGRAQDIDWDGALLVDSGGRTERIVAGEVVWEGLSRE